MPLLQVHYAIIYILVTLSVFLRMIWEIPYFAIPMLVSCCLGWLLLLLYVRKLKAAKMEFQQVGGGGGSVVVEEFGV